VITMLFDAFSTTTGKFPVIRIKCFWLWRKPEDILAPLLFNADSSAVPDTLTDLLKNFNKCHNQ
jgi:hypothetical protein